MTAEAVDSLVRAAAGNVRAHARTTGLPRSSEVKPWAIQPMLLRQARQDDESRWWSPTLRDRSPPHCPEHSVSQADEHGRL